MLTFSFTGKLRIPGLKAVVEVEAGWENKKQHTLGFECPKFQLFLKRTVLKDLELKLIFSLNNLRESENVTAAAIGNIKSEFRNSDSNLNALTSIRMLGRLYFLRVRAIQTSNEREVFFWYRYLRPHTLSKA